MGERDDDMPAGANAPVNLTEDPVEIFDEARPEVEVELESGKRIIAEAVLFSIGRTPVTDSLNLGAAGVETDKRGRITVDESFQSNAPGVYAAGDVIGFPALAATSSEQGRIAACRMFGADAGVVRALASVRPRTLHASGLGGGAMSGRLDGALAEGVLALGDVGKAVADANEGDLVKFGPGLALVCHLLRWVADTEGAGEAKAKELLAQSGLKLETLLGEDDAEAGLAAFLAKHKLEAMAGDE